MWEEHFDSLLHSVKDYVVNIWEVRKTKFYGDDSSHCQSSIWDLGDFTLRGRLAAPGRVGYGKFHCKNMCHRDKPDTGKFHSSYIGMNVCGSTYENGSVINRMCATAAD